MIRINKSIVLVQKKKYIYIYIYIYSRVSPQDFVDFTGLAMIIENIKKACTIHFDQAQHWGWSPPGP
jgi:hypothetical protein